MNEYAKPTDFEDLRFYDDCVYVENREIPDFRLRWCELGRLVKVVTKLVNMLVVGRTTRKNFKIYRVGRVYVKHNVIYFTFGGWDWLSESWFSAHAVPLVSVEEFGEKFEGFSTPLYTQLKNLQQSMVTPYTAFRHDDDANQSNRWYALTKNSRPLFKHAAYELKTVTGTTYTDMNYTELLAQRPTNGKLRGFYRPYSKDLMQTQTLILTSLEKKK